MPDRLRGFTTRHTINPLYLYLKPNPNECLHSWLSVGKDIEAVQIPFYRSSYTNSEDFVGWYWS